MPFLHRLDFSIIMYIQLYQIIGKDLQYSKKPNHEQSLT